MDLSRAAILVLGAAACTAPDSRAPAFSSSAEWDLRELASLGHSELEWGYVAAVVPVSDDALVVADGAARTLTILDRKGRVVGLVGGKGRGPSEFVDIDAVGAFRGDSVIVHDAKAQRLTVLDVLTGGARTIRLQLSSGVYLRGVLHDSVPVMFGGPQTRSSVAGIAWDSAAVLQVGPTDGRVDTLGVWPRSVVASGPDHPFFLISARSIVTARGSRICHARSDQRAVRCFGPADHDTVVIEWTQPRGAVTDEVKRHRVGAQLQNPPPGIPRADLRRRLDEALWPDSLPLIGHPLILESDGTVWVPEYTLSEVAPRTWRVFSPGGAIIGVVTTPPEFEPHAVVDNELWGVWRDSLDVTSVRGFQISR